MIWCKICLFVNCKQLVKNCAIFSLTDTQSLFLINLVFSCKLFYRIKVWGFNEAWGFHFQTVRFNRTPSFICARRTWFPCDGLKFSASYIWNNATQRDCKQGLFFYFFYLSNCVAPHVSLLLISVTKLVCVAWLLYLFALIIKLLWWHYFEKKNKDFK